MSAETKQLSYLQKGLRLLGALIQWRSIRAQVRDLPEKNVPVTDGARGIYSHRRYLCSVERLHAGFRIFRQQGQLRLRTIETGGVLRTR